MKREQFNVACSRVTSENILFIYAPNQNTNDIVNQEVFYLRAYTVYTKQKVLEFIKNTTGTRVECFFYVQVKFLEYFN